MIFVGMYVMTHEELLNTFNYDPETGIFTWKNVGKNHHRKNGDVAGCVDKTTGYYKVYSKGRTYLGHRLAWFYVHGEMPKNIIDHINGDKADNRISNLQDVTVSQNAENTRRPRGSNKTSQYLGVSWNTASGKYVAQIMMSGKAKFLGYFQKEEEARDAYLEAKRRLHRNCQI